MKACVDALHLPRAARSIHGSADPNVLKAFSVLNKGTRLPKGIDLSSDLSADSVSPTSYDPTHAGLLSATKAGREYLIPVKLPTIRQPRACSKVPGMNAYLAMLAHEVGAGPGVCWVSLLPGDGSETPDGCASLARINGFSDFLASSGPSGTQAMPDGVSSMRYVFRDGRTQTRRVVNNLVFGPHLPKPPAKLQRIKKFTAATAHLLQAWLARNLPTTVNWQNAQGSVIATYQQPRGYVTSYVKAFAFMLSVLRPAASSSTSTSATTATTVQPHSG